MVHLKINSLAIVHAIGEVASFGLLLGLVSVRLTVFRCHSAAARCPKRCAATMQYAGEPSLFERLPAFEFPFQQAIIIHPSAHVKKPDVPLIDSGEAAALEVQQLLKSKNLGAMRDTRELIERQLCDDLDHFYVTDAAERFAKVAERFLGSSPSVLEAVEVWGHDELRTY